MAFQKKATCYILNVNHSMSLYPDNAFSKALQTITNTIEDRALAGRKTDLVSVLLCGTPETNNTLAEETPGQYENIDALTPLAMPNIALLQRLNNVTTSKETDPTADVLDALIVAIQMIAAHCRNLKYTKRVVIFTDNQSEIDWRDIDAVADMLKSNDIELHLVGVDYDQLESPDCPEIVKTNYQYWNKLVECGIEGDVGDLEEAYAQTKEIYIKDVRPTPSYRGYLYLGSPLTNEHFLPISVNMYLRTKEVKLPSSHKVSALSDGPSRDVNMVSKFLLEVRDPDTLETSEIEIPKENLQKGYKFGKSILIISEEEMGASKLMAKKEMSIIGFIPADKFPRHYLYSNAYILTPGSHRIEESAKALSALSTAMYEKNYYALIRYVAKDEGVPRIAILEPELDEKAPILQFFDIPYADDVRDYKFRSVKKAKTDQESLDLMEALVDRMNLDFLEDKYKETCPEGYLAPEHNFNPIAYRLSMSIRSRALNEASAIPDVDPRFNAQFQLEEDVKRKIGDLGEEIANFYEVKLVRDKGKKRARGQIDEDSSQFGDPAAINDILNTAISDSRETPNMDTDLIPSLTGRKITKIGLVDPVKDFKDMLKSKDDGDMVEEAISQLSKIVFQLLNKSFGNQHYQKVHYCLEAFRETAAEEDEAKKYNTTIKGVKEWCTLSDPDTPRREMWKMIKTSNLGIITSDECQDTDIQDVTKEDAEKFWNEKEEEEVKPTSNNDAVVFDADNLDDLF